MSALTSIPSSSTTSESILTTLLAEAGNDRRHQTLQRLKEACDTLAARGKSFKLSDVQRVVEEMHGSDAGPKAQSISNERKRTLGMYHYVEARERELAASRAPRRSVRTGRAETAMMATLDRIRDIDVRSAMHDVHDRMVVAEKALERAKVLFKTLQPGADVERLLAGQGVFPTTEDRTIPRDQVAALQRLVSILTDDTKLATVGMTFDGNRVRRKSGTRDELLGPDILSSVAALSQSLM